MKDKEMQHLRGSSESYDDAGEVTDTGQHDSVKKSLLHVVPARLQRNVSSIRIWWQQLGTIWRSRITLASWGALCMCICVAVMWSMWHFLMQTQVQVILTRRSAQWALDSFGSFSIKQAAFKKAASPMLTYPEAYASEWIDSSQALAFNFSKFQQSSERLALSLQMMARQAVLAGGAAGSAAACLVALAPTASSNSHPKAVCGMFDQKISTQSRPLSSLRIWSDNSNNCMVAADQGCIGQVPTIPTPPGAINLPELSTMTVFDNIQLNYTDTTGNFVVVRGFLALSLDALLGLGVVEGPANSNYGMLPSYSLKEKSLGCGQPAGDSKKKLFGRMWLGVLKNSESIDVIPTLRRCIGCQEDDQEFPRLPPFTQDSPLGDRTLGTWHLSSQQLLAFKYPALHLLAIVEIPSQVANQDLTHADGFSGAIMMLFASFFLPAMIIALPKSIEQSVLIADRLKVKQLHDQSAKRALTAASACTVLPLLFTFGLWLFAGGAIIEKPAVAMTSALACSQSMLINAEFNRTQSQVRDGLHAPSRQNAADNATVGIVASFLNQCDEDSVDQIHRLALTVMGSSAEFASFNDSRSCLLSAVKSNSKNQPGVSAQICSPPLQFSRLHSCIELRHWTFGNISDYRSHHLYSLDTSTPSSYDEFLTSPKIPVLMARSFLLPPTSDLQNRPFPSVSATGKLAAVVTSTACGSHDQYVCMAAFDASVAGPRTPVEIATMSTSPISHKFVPESLWKLDPYGLSAVDSQTWMNFSVSASKSEVLSVGLITQPGLCVVAGKPTPLPRTLAQVSTCPTSSGGSGGLGVNTSLWNTDEGAAPLWEGLSLLVDSFMTNHEFGWAFLPENSAALGASSAYAFHSGDVRRPTTAINVLNNGAGIFAISTPFWGYHIQWYRGRVITALWCTGLFAVSMLLIFRISKAQARRLTTGKWLSLKLKKSAMFKERSKAFVEAVCEELFASFCKPGDKVVRKGEIGTEMYFLTQGKAKVVNEQSGEVYATLKQGTCFGEIALLLKTPRTATIVADTYCDLLVLEKASLQSVLNRFPEAKASFEELALQRQKELDSTAYHQNFQDTQNRDIEDIDIQLDKDEARQKQRTLTFSGIKAEVVTGLQEQDEIRQTERMQFAQIHALDASRMGGLWTNCNHRQQAKMHRLYHSQLAQVLACIFSGGLLCLTFVEPASRKDTVSSSRYWGSLGTEFACLIALLLDEFLALYVYRLQRLKQAVGINLLVCKILMFIDCCRAAAIGPPTLRPFRILRGVVFIARIRSLRHALKLMVSTLPSVKGLFALLGSFLVCVALLMVLLFRSDYNWASDLNGFWNIQESLASLAVLSTSENYPFIAVPAFLSSQVSTVLFAGFMIVSLFFFVPGVIAQFYQSYKLALREILIAQRKDKLLNLSAAFKALDYCNSGVIQTAYLQQALAPANLYLETTVSKINLQDFVQSVGTIKPQNQDEVKTGGALRSSRIRAWISSICYQNVRSGEGTKHSLKQKAWFSALIQLLTIIHVVVCASYGAIFFDQYEYSGATWAMFGIIPNSCYIDGAQVVLIWIYAVEMVIKLSTFGLQGLWRRDAFHKIDLILVLVAFGASVGALAKIHNPAECTLSSSPAYRFFMGLCLLRVMTQLRASAFFLRAFASVVPAVGPIAVLGVVILMEFGIVGMELFASFKRPSDGELAADPRLWNELLESGVTGFHSMYSSLLSLLQLVVAANFNSLAGPFATRIGAAVYLFFFPLLVLCHIFLYNLFVGVVLDGFVFKLQKQINRKKEWAMWRAMNSVTEIMEGKEDPKDGSQNTGQIIGNVCYICAQPLHAQHAANLWQNDPAGPRLPGSNTDSKTKCQNVDIVQPYPSCTHKFHLKCVLEYTWKRMECPQCRGEQSFGNDAGRARIQRSLVQEIYGEDVEMSVSLEVVEAQSARKLEQACYRHRLAVINALSSRGVTSHVHIIGQSGFLHMVLMPGTFTVQHLLDLACDGAPIISGRTHFLDWLREEMSAAHNLGSKAVTAVVSQRPLTYLPSQVSPSQRHGNGGLTARLSVAYQDIKSLFNEDIEVCSNQNLRSGLTVELLVTENHCWEAAPEAPESGGNDNNGQVSSLSNNQQQRSSHSQACSRAQKNASLAIGGSVLDASAKRNTKLALLADRAYSIWLCLEPMQEVNVPDSACTAVATEDFPGTNEDDQAQQFQDTRLVETSETIPVISESNRAQDSEDVSTDVGSPS